MIFYCKFQLDLIQSEEREYIWQIKYKLLQLNRKPPKSQINLIVTQLKTKLAKGEATNQAQN